MEPTKVIWAGRHLEDGQRLFEFVPDIEYKFKKVKIVNESTIHLVLRLHGGTDFIDVSDKSKASVRQWDR